MVSVHGLAAMRCALGNLTKLSGGLRDGRNDLLGWLVQHVQLGLHHGLHDIIFLGLQLHLIMIYMSVIFFMLLPLLLVLRRQYGLDRGA